MQRETSQQLRTIITSAAHNTPPLGGCAKESVTAAGDSSAVSPSASGSRDLALDAGGASSWWVAECVSSGVTRVQFLHGLAFAGLCHPSVGRPSGVRDPSGALR